MKKLLSIVLSLALVACMMPSMVYGLTVSENHKGYTVTVTKTDSEASAKLEKTGTEDLFGIFTDIADFSDVDVKGTVNGENPCTVVVSKDPSKITVTAKEAQDRNNASVVYPKLKKVVSDWTTSESNSGTRQAVPGSYVQISGTRVVVNADGKTTTTSKEVTPITGCKVYLKKGTYAAKGDSVTLDNDVIITCENLVLHNSDLGGATVGTNLDGLKIIANAAINKITSDRIVPEVNVEIVPNTSGGGGTVTPPSNIETVVKEEIDKDGNKITTTTTTNKDTGAVNEVVETVRPDGTKTVVTTDTQTETKADGSVVKTESVVTVDTDKAGNSTETKVETVDVTRPDGTQTTTTTTTNADKSKVVEEKDVTYNSFDNKVVTETTTKISATGEVSAVQTITIGTKIVGPIDVDVKLDSEGAVESAFAEYTRTGKTATGGIQTLLNGNHVKQVVEAVGGDTGNTTVKATINKPSGQKAYTVTANAADLQAGNVLYVVGIDKNGKKVLVNTKSYTVTKNGSVTVTLPSGMDYQLITKAQKSALVKSIKATIAPTATKKSVTKGKTSTMALKKTLNKANVSKITYSTTNKAVATVSKLGKITAKKKGTVTIKATVTLKDGSKKTVSTKVTVK